MTRATYRALKRSIWLTHKRMNMDIAGSWFADSPSWAAAQAELRGEATLHELILQFPKPEPNEWAELQRRQSIRRHQTLSRIHERKRQAQLQAPRLEGEGLLDWISRRCGFVKDTHPA